MRHHGQPLDVAAQVIIRNRQRHLVFNQGLLLPAQYTGRQMVGVSDLGVSPVGSLLAISNASLKTRRVTVEAVLGNHRWSQTIELSSHKTRLLPLLWPFDTGAPHETAFGIQVRHDGSRGDVMVHGLLMGAGGLAANLRVTDPAMLQSRRALSPVLRLRSEQRPRLALYNYSPTFLLVRPLIQYRLGGSVRRRSLSPLLLEPRSAHGRDLSRELAALPAKAQDLNLSLEYEKNRSSPVAELLIMDPASRSVVQATPKDTQREGTIGMTAAWRLDGEANTVIALANPSDTEEIRFRLFLFYNHETYTWAGDKRLPPGAAKHIDIRRLRDEQIEDERGATIPRDAMAGQAKYFVDNRPDQKAGKLLGQAIQIGTGGSLTAFLSCPVCPPDPSHVRLSPLNLSGNIGTSEQITPWIRWADDSESLLVNPAVINWDVENTDVATVSEAWNNFRVNFKGVGTTEIDASASDCHYENVTEDPDLPAECVCQNTVTVTAQPTASAATTCPVPTGETTTATGWADENDTPAVHKFVQTLKPTGTSFAGRKITESNTQAATDTCWFPESAVPKVTGVTGGNWRVGPDNRWGSDHVGWTDLGHIQYYRDEGEAPCGFTMYQTLTISGCGGGSSSSVYRTNVPLKSTFTDTHVTVSRSGVSKTRELTIE